MAAKARIAIMFLVGIMLLLSACSGSQPNAQPSAPIPPPSPPVSSGDEPYQGTPLIEPARGPVLVEITDQGFSPPLLTVSQGTTVTFVNKDGSQRWPASDIHPTHTAYPGSTIRKCNTGEQAAIFDSCKGLAAGEIFRFTFTEKGNWNYHDHLDADVGGTIVVQ